MSPITLHQDSRTFPIREIEFQPVSEFEHENTWYMTDEAILAELDGEDEPEPGLAELHYDGQTFPVTIATVHFEKLPGEEDEALDEDPEDPEGIMIEITPEEGSLSDLAAQLGLLEDPENQAD